MKMVKSVYKKILDNVPTHMPETGGMLGGAGRHCYKGCV